MLTNDFLEEKKAMAAKLRREALVGGVEFSDYERGYWNGYAHAIDDALKQLNQDDTPPGI